MTKVSQKYKNDFNKETTQEWIRDYYKKDFDFIFKMRHGDFVDQLIVHQLEMNLKHI